MCLLWGSMSIIARRAGGGGRSARSVCASFLSSSLIALASIWLGIGLGWALALKKGAASVPAALPAAATSPLVRGASAQSPRAALPVAQTPLAAALHGAMASLHFLQHERMPFVRHTMRLTGHPPLVSRTDTSANGEPDFENFGLPPAIPPPSFVVADPWEGTPAATALADAEPDVRAHVYSPLRYVMTSEDTSRDIAVAVVGSPGFVRGGAVTCRANPATQPFGCLATLRATRPELFAPDGAPLPAEAGGPLVLDVGYTAAGYYGLLSAATGGVSALVVDTQPQCALWARTSADASGLAQRVRVVTAVPLPASEAPGGAGEGGFGVVAARMRTGCVGTSLDSVETKLSDVRSYYDNRAAAAAADDRGRAEAVAARSHPGTVGVPALGDVGGASTVDVPVASVDDILCATYGGAMCGGGAGEGGRPTPPILLVKIDARGRTVETLAGMKGILSRPATRPQNLLIELSKMVRWVGVGYCRGAATLRAPSSARHEPSPTFTTTTNAHPTTQHTAAVMGLPSAVAAAKNAGTTSADVLVSGYDITQYALSEEDDKVVSKVFLNLAQGLLDLGYEFLVSDRGWWAAQEAFNPTSLGKTDGKLLDGTTLASWAEKISMRTEIDLWAYAAPMV